MSTTITVRITEKEKNMVENLAKYLYRRGNIEEPTISEAVRNCIHTTVGIALKTIEAERYAR